MLHSGGSSYSALLRHPLEISRILPRAGPWSRLGPVRPALRSANSLPTLLPRYGPLFRRQRTAPQAGRVERDAAFAQTPESAGRRRHECWRCGGRAGRIIVEADVTLGPLRKGQTSTGHSVLVLLLLKWPIGGRCCSGGVGLVVVASVGADVRWWRILCWKSIWVRNSHHRRRGRTSRRR